MALTVAIGQLSLNCPAVDSWQQQVERHAGRGREAKRVGGVGEGRRACEARGRVADTESRSAGWVLGSGLGFKEQLAWDGMRWHGAGERGVRQLEAAERRGELRWRKTSWPGRVVGVGHGERRGVRRMCVGAEKGGGEGSSRSSWRVGKKVAVLGMRGREARGRGSRAHCTVGKRREERDRIAEHGKSGDIGWQGIVEAMSSTAGRAARVLLLASYLLLGPSAGDLQLYCDSLRHVAASMAGEHHGSSRGGQAGMRGGQLQHGHEVAAASAVDKSVEQFLFGKNGKVFDKFATVISGPVVTSDAISAQVRSVLSQEEEEWLQLPPWLRSAADAVSPLSNSGLLFEAESSLVASLAAAEALLEKFVAFELSMLAIQGEKLAILAPFLAGAMWWNMRSDSKDSAPRSKTTIPAAATSGSSFSPSPTSSSPPPPSTLSRPPLLSGRGERVREELRRLRLKHLLLREIEELKQLDLLAGGPGEGSERKGEGKGEEKILQTIAQLGSIWERHMQEREERGEGSSSGVGGEGVRGGVGVGEVEEVADMRLSTDASLAGQWRLVYLSGPDPSSSLSQLSPAPPQPSPLLPSAEQQLLLLRQLSSLLRPLGIQLADMKQTVAVAGRTSLNTAAARNSAEIRLGPLGTIFVSLDGSMMDPSSIDTSTLELSTFGSLKLLAQESIQFQAVSIRLLQSPIASFPPQEQPLPLVQLPLPRQVQFTLTWTKVYLDEDLRIDKLGMNAYFVSVRSKM